MTLFYQENLANSNEFLFLPIRVLWLVSLGLKYSAFTCTPCPQLKFHRYDTRDIRVLRIWQRRRQWKRCWKIGSYETFSLLYQVTHLFESRKVRLELKSGDSVRVQREMLKFIALPFLFSSQLKTWSFHVGSKKSNVISFIILLSGEGLTFFNKNNHVSFSDEIPTKTSNLVLII